MTTTLSNDDVSKVIRELPVEILLLLTKYPGQLFLAGGYIRATLAGETPKDIDLFGTNNVLLLEARGYLEDLLHKDDYNFNVGCTLNATTFNVSGIPESIQFIERWTYDRPEDLIKSFDFTISQAAITYQEFGGYKSVCSPDFYSDLATKTLNYTSPNRKEELAGSLQRVMKFVAKGYTIGNDSLSKVIARAISKIEEEVTEEDAGTSSGFYEVETIDDSKVAHRLYNRLSRCNGNKY